jgi:UPF0271 protein
MTRYIDLNCDMGESFGAYTLGMDEEVIRLISSVNVACGYHAGDPNVMDLTVQRAREHGVGIGAHPGFPDLLGFGRRNMDVDQHDLTNMIIYQIGALQAFCRKHGVALQHVKPHGSLNNMADTDRAVAEAIVDATLAVDRNLLLFVKPNSELERVAKSKRARIVLELFADRAYDRDLRLLSRKQEGAVISDTNAVAERVLRMVTEGKIRTADGTDITVDGQTICVHGDTPSALHLIQAIRRTLAAANIIISPVRQWMNHE